MIFKAGALVLEGLIAICGSSAVAQEFEPWTVEQQGPRVVASTSAVSEESGDFWWRFEVTRTSSMGVSMDSLGFTLSFGSYADYIGPGYRGWNGRALGNRVVITTDTGETFRSHSARMNVANEAVSIDIGFLPMDQDDGVLRPSDPDCRVVNALRRASTFTVQFPDLDGTSQFEFTGRGSTRALAGIGGC